MLNLEEYVKVISTGVIGRIEQWHQGVDKYWVEFNRDFATRQWFSEVELERVQPPVQSTGE